MLPAVALTITSLGAVKVQRALLLVLLLILSVLLLSVLSLSFSEQMSERRTSSSSKVEHGWWIYSTRV